MSDTTATGNLLPQLAIAAAMTLGIGLLSPLVLDDPGAGWAAYVVGAVLALSLWVGQLAGTWGSQGDRVGPPTLTYLIGAIVAVGLGAAMVMVMDTLVAWAIGTIVAIATGSADAIRRRL